MEDYDSDSKHTDEEDIPEIPEHNLQEGHNYDPIHDPDYAPNTDFFVQDYYHCDAAIDFQMQQHDDMAVPFMVVFEHSEISIAPPLCAMMMRRLLPIDLINLSFISSHSVEIKIYFVPFVAYASKMLDA